VDDPCSASSCGRAIQKKYGVHSVVITLGAQGAVLVVPGRSLAYPSHEANVVDTQGAGDAFTGSLAAKLSESVSIEQAVSFANWVAAQSVSHSGSTQASLPKSVDAAGVDLNRYSAI
jgi:ribokinase